MLITAQFIRQTEQPNHYWLIQWTAPVCIELPVNFFIKVEGIQLNLFSQKLTNNLSNNQIQFLAKQPLQQTKNLQFNFNNHQKWYFLSDFEKKLSLNRTHCLLVSKDNIAQAFYLSKQLGSKYSLVLIMEAQEDFPFPIKPARFMFDNLPIEAAHMIGACPLLEDWKIPNRLCSHSGIPGCFDGSLDLFKSVWQPPSDWFIIHL